MSYDKLKIYYTGYDERSYGYRTKKYTVNLNKTTIEYGERYGYNMISVTFDGFGCRLHGHNGNLLLEKTDYDVNPNGIERIEWLSSTDNTEQPKVLESKPQPAPAPKQEPKETEPKKETPKPQPAKKVEIKENTVNGKTTYSFNGEDGLSKSKLCLSIIRYYIEQNPDITVSQLREMFNIKNNNMVETIDGALKICDSSGKAGGNYSMKDADQIATKEGKVVVWNYWPERYFDPFMEIVEKHVFASSDKKDTPKPQPASAPKQEPKKETPKPQPAPAPKAEPKAEPKKEAPKPEVRRPSADDMNVLDKLIDAALEDFVLTDEEKSVLLKKSKEIGLGEDEFKIYLNGKIQERMKDKPEEKVEEKKKGFFARLFGR